MKLKNFISIFFILFFSNFQLCALTYTPYMHIRYLLRFFDCLAHPNLSATLATDQKWPLCHLRISYQSLAGGLRSLQKSEFLKLIILIFHIKKIKNSDFCKLLRLPAKLWYEIQRWHKGHFSSVAKVALRFGCAKQSTNLKRYLTSES